MTLLTTTDFAVTRYDRRHVGYYIHFTGSTSRKKIACIFIIQDSRTVDYPPADMPHSILSVIEYYKSLSLSKKLLISGVCGIVTLLLVMPATNATGERSFSALQRVKHTSFLRCVKID